MISFQNKANKLILDLILSGQYPVGTALPTERALAKKFDVSRSIVHLALVDLQQEGFIEFKPRHGAYVTDYTKQPTINTLNTIMNYDSSLIDKNLFNGYLSFRSLIEVECVRLCCVNATIEDLQKLEDIFISIKGNTKDLSQKYNDFHYQIVLSSKNVLYAMIFKSYQPIIIKLMEKHYLLSPQDIDKSLSIHHELLLAIKDRDQEKSAQLMKKGLNLGYTALQNLYR